MSADYCTRRPEDSPLTEVRRLQRQGTRLRRRYLSSGTSLAQCRDAIQKANDWRFRNPPKDANAERKEAWAQRWLTAFEKALDA